MGEEQTRAVCALADIDDPGSRGFEIELGDEESLRFFVVRKNGQLFAYRNHCPHTGAPMEWLPDQFLDIDNSFIQCSIHGALFRPEDGYCLRGPCVGQSLQALRLSVEDGQVSLYLPDE